MKVITLFLVLVANAALAMPNPASVNCTKVGGSLKIESPSEGSMGICYFQDGKQCEEWALFRGNCPVGGVDVTNLTSAERHCAIRGGSYNAQNGCTLPGEVGASK